MRITIVGHVCIDRNISEQGVLYTSAGGPAVFMQRVLSLLPSTTVSIISPHGADFASYKAQLPLYPRTPTSPHTLGYENNSLGTVRTQKAYRRENAKPMPFTDELVSILSASDLLFFAPLTADYSYAYVANMLTHVSQQTFTILLPQGYFRSFDPADNVLERTFIEAEDIVPLFNAVITSEQDHSQMMTIAHKWSKQTLVIVTQGEKGSVCLHNGSTTYCPVKPVAKQDIVDSVGSGEIYSACFGYQYVRTQNVESAMQFATEIARQCLFSPSDKLKITV